VTVALLFLLAGVLMVVAGAAAGDFRSVHRFASHLCLSCMGLM